MSNNAMMQQPYIPGSKDEAEKIAGIIRDISDSMAIMEAKRDQIKEQKKALKEDYEIPLKVINLMVRLFHKGDYQEYFDEQGDMQEMYDALFPETEDKKK